MTNKIPRPMLGFSVAMAALMASVIIITWLLRTQDLSAPVRFILALVPPLVWVFCLAFLLRAIRLLDELQQRIHLEALAIAFPSVAVGILVCEYLRKAGFISHLKPDYVLMMMLALWGIGFLIAWRRY